MNDSFEERIKNMSRDELFILLGKENAEKLRKKLADGTLSPKSLAEIVDSVPTLTYEQATQVITSIVLSFSKTEMFAYLEPDPDSKKEYVKVARIEERVKEEMDKYGGKILPETLDILFKMIEMNDPFLESFSKVFFVLNGKVKLSPEQIAEIQTKTPRTIEDLLAIVYRENAQSNAEKSLKGVGKVKEPRAGDKEEI